LKKSKISKIYLAKLVIITHQDIYYNLHFLGQTIFTMMFISKEKKIMFFLITDKFKCNSPLIEKVLVSFEFLVIHIEELRTGDAIQEKQ